MMDSLRSDDMVYGMGMHFTDSQWREIGTYLQTSNRQQHEAYRENIIQR